MSVRQDPPTRAPFLQASRVRPSEALCFRSRIPSTRIDTSLEQEKRNTSGPRGLVGYPSLYRPTRLMDQGCADSLAWSTDFLSAHRDGSNRSDRTVLYGRPAKQRSSDRFERYCKTYVVRL